MVVWQVLLKILCFLQIAVYTDYSDCNYRPLFSMNSLHLKYLCLEVYLLPVVAPQHIWTAQAVQYVQVFYWSDLQHLVSVTWN